jgi:hypothetical protein
VMLTAGYGWKRARKAAPISSVVATSRSEMECMRGEYHPGAAARNLLGEQRYARSSSALLNSASSFQNSSNARR